MRFCPKNDIQMFYQRKLFVFLSFIRVLTFTCSVSRVRVTPSTDKYSDVLVDLLFAAALHWAEAMLFSVGILSDGENFLSGSNLKLKDSLNDM